MYIIIAYSLNHQSVLFGCGPILDIDECFLGKYSCPRGTICLNLPGGYECSPNVFELQKIEVIPDCPTGFFYSRHVKDCIGLHSILLAE